MVVKQALVTVLLPAAATAAALLLGLIVSHLARPRPRKDDEARKRARRTAGGIDGAIGIAAAFCITYLGISNWRLPEFPPLSLLEWTPYIVAATAIAAIITAPRAIPLPLRWVLRAAIAALIAAAVLHRTIGDSWTAPASIALLSGVAVYTLLLWMSTHELAVRTGSGWTAAAMLIIAGAGAAVFVLGYSARLSQLSASLAAAMGACMILAWLRPGACAGAAAGVISAALVSLWVIGEFFEVPAVGLGILALAPFAPWAGSLPGVRSLRPWQIGTARLTATTLLSAAAVAATALSRDAPLDYM